MDFDVGDILTLIEWDVKSEVKENTSSRFGTVVSDEDLRSLIEDQVFHQVQHKMGLWCVLDMARAEGGG